MATALLDQKTDGRETGAPIVLAAAATGLVDFIERQHGDVDSIFGNASFGKSFKNRAFQACLANANKSDATVRDPLKEDSPMMQEFRMDFVALIE